MRWSSMEEQPSAAGVEPVDVERADRQAHVSPAGL
jgi:hypothetical protein